MKYILIVAAPLGFGLMQFLEVAAGAFSAY
jgi:hypothetical protein